MNDNLIIDIISAIIVFVLLAFEHRMKKSTTDCRLLRLLMVCVLTVFVMDIPGLLLDGATVPGARALLWVFDTAYWLSHSAYGWLWLMFVDDQLFDRAQHLKKYRRLYALPMLCEIVLILLNPLTRWIFTLDATNTYVTGSAYLFNLIPYYVYVGWALLLTLYGYLKKRGEEQKRRCLFLLISMFLPICGMVLEIFAYGVTWVWPFTAISLLMVYMDLQSQRLSAQRVLAVNEAARTAQLQNELTNSRVKIMLSQIQPHFVYNSLSVIQALCEIDPALAAKATENFTVYLRCNMDSLSSDQPIPFEQELQHTKRYLSLEKLRFEDALRIEFDIQTTDFSLPALTLQPIAESAVRYGITKCEDGGTLLIATRQTDADYEITIRDTGVGADAYSSALDDQTRIEISNVRSHLETMCSATLTVTNEPGIGTEVKILIPKQGNEEGLC